MQRGVLKLLNDCSLWILTEAPKLQPYITAESTKFCTKFSSSDTTYCTWLSVHHRHNQIHNHELHTSILALLPGNRKEPIRLMQQPKGTCTNSGPSFHTSISEGTSGGSTESSVSFIFSSKQKKLLVCVLVDGRDQLLSPSPCLLPDLQLWSLINYYSAGNFRESDREQRGHQANNKNADGENILTNNIRLALNSELVSPRPIKSPLPCAPFWDVRHAV